MRKDMRKHVLLNCPHSSYLAGMQWTQTVIKFIWLPLVCCCSLWVAWALQMGAMGGSSTETRLPLPVPASHTLLGNASHRPHTLREQGNWSHHRRLSLAVSGRELLRTSQLYPGQCGDARSSSCPGEVQGRKQQTPSAGPRRIHLGRDPTGMVRRRRNRGHGFSLLHFRRVVSKN